MKYEQRKLPITGLMAWFDEKGRFVATLADAPTLKALKQYVGGGGMTKAKTKTFIVTIRVKSRTGERPIVRTIGGDTVFCSLIEGMTASWTMKRQTPKPKVSA